MSEKPHGMRQNRTDRAEVSRLPESHILAFAPTVGTGEFGKNISGGHDLTQDIPTLKEPTEAENFNAGSKHFAEDKQSKNAESRAPVTISTLKKLPNPYLKYLIPASEPREDNAPELFQSSRSSLLGDAVIHKLQERMASIKLDSSDVNKLCMSVQHLAIGIGKVNILNRPFDDVEEDSAEIIDKCLDMLSNLSLDPTLAALKHPELPPPLPTFTWRKASVNDCWAIWYQVDGQWIRLPHTAWQWRKVEARWKPWLRVDGDFERMKVCYAPLRDLLTTQNEGHFNHQISDLAKQIRGLDLSAE